jgi:hypothetical protein
MEEWLSFVGKWTLVPLATIAVFEGARRLSWARSGWNAAALLLFGVGILGGYAGSLAWVASGIESTFGVLDQRSPPSLPESTLAQMTPQEREEKTRLLARIAFESAGILTTYISATGEQVRYAPSENEIRDRQTLRESLAQIRTRVEFIRAQVWMFSLSAIAAAVAGVCARSFRGGRRAG